MQFPSVRIDLHLRSDAEAAAAERLAEALRDFVDDTPIDSWLFDASGIAELIEEIEGEVTNFHIDQRIKRGQG